MPRPLEHPATRSAGSWVFDALVTLLAMASALPYLFHHHTDQHAPAVVVLIVMVAPLALRRVRPVLVFGWILVVAVGAGLWDDHVIPGLALVIALYTVAALQPRRDALVAAGLLELVMIGAAIRLSGSGWWFDAIFLSGMIAAAVGLGLYSATRRAYLDELHDRAERLERERDRQGELSAAAERARIAREMHDIVAHHLTVMVALSDGAIAASTASPQRAADVMREVSATGRRALQDTRRLLGVLHKHSDDDAEDALQPVPDLAELDVLIERVRAAGLATSLEVKGAETEVPAGVQLTVYRLVQEALTNTLKHAGPGARAAVRLEYTADELRVDIDDDGAGAAAPVPVGVGSGLVGMQERVHAYGGDVESGPRRDGGWRVSARLHLETGDTA
jgi:signal transduction histidine kinase